MVEPEFGTARLSWVNSVLSCDHGLAQKQSMQKKVRRQIVCDQQRQLGERIDTQQRDDNRTSLFQLAKPARVRPKGSR